MTEGKTVGGGRLWGEVAGIAVIFFVAQIIAAILGSFFYAFFLSDPGAAATDLTDPAVAARIAIYTLPIATILTLVAANFMLKSRGVHWQDLGLRKPGSIFKTILYGLGIFIITAVIGGLVNIGMESQGYTQDLSLFDVLQDDFVMFLFLATVISWFSAAFAEEFIFRGLIMGNIARSLGNTQKAWIIAAVVQAIIFGLFHAYQGLNGFVAVFAIALVFGFFYYKTRSLWPIIVAHGIMDTFGMTMLYLNVDIPV